MNIQEDLINISDRIGPSTHFMPKTKGETIYDAIDATYEAGFRAFELVPTEDQAQVGWPVNHPNTGVTPKNLSVKERRRLRSALTVFKMCTIHSPHLDFNVASANRKLRKISMQAYNEILELALDLEVSTVTFHPGHATEGYIRDPKDWAKYEIEYGKKALAFAEKNGLEVGYEVCNNFEHMKLIIDSVGGNFGLNLDLGHAMIADRRDEVLLEYIEHFQGRIKEIHMNGVNHYWGGFMEHQPVHMNNVIDYQTVFERLREINYQGPIITEIQGNDLKQMLIHCQEAKEMIIGIWNKTRKLRTRWNRAE